MKGFRGSSHIHRRTGESCGVYSKDRRLRLCCKTDLKGVPLLPSTRDRGTGHILLFTPPDAAPAAVAWTLLCPPGKEPMSHFSGSLALHSMSQASVSELGSWARACLRCRNSGESSFPGLCLPQDSRKRVQVLGHQEE